MIATDLADGSGPADENLRDRLVSCVQEGQMGLPIAELLRYVVEVANELDRRTEPHGDIKPETIRLIGGRAVLTDTMVESEPSGATTGTITATPLYTAPELICGTLTARSDQYALACTYAELRTGHAPFRGTGVMEIMHAHKHSTPNLDGCAEAEQIVLSKALAKSPEQRYPTCSRWVEELKLAIVSGPR